MTKFKLELKWAFMISIAALLWMFLERMMGWHEEKIAERYWLTLLFLPIAITMYTLAIRQKRRKHYGEKMTWLQGFLTGLKVSFFVALLSPLGNYVTHKYISPRYFDNIIDYSVTNELMTVEKANEYFNISNTMLQTGFGALLGGTVIALIVAVFLKKD